jgi:hypothetical protein
MGSTGGAMITLIFTLMGILGMLTAYLFIGQSARIRELEYHLGELADQVLVMTKHITVVLEKMEKKL